MYSKEFGGGSFDSVEYPDRGAVCKFNGFTRDVDGNIVVKERPSGAPGSDEVANYVYVNCGIVSPASHAGQDLPLRVKLKGIHCFKDDGGQWHFHFTGLGIDEGFKPTGLFQNAKEMGFKIAMLDPQSQLYEENDEGCPVYIQDEVTALVENAVMPLTPVQVLRWVVEPKLFQAAEQGHLFNVRTTNISWVKWDSLAALSSEEAETIRQQAVVAQAQGEAEADQIRSWIRQKASEAEDPQAFVGRIASLAVDVQPDVDTEHLLDTCSVETLRHIKARLEPQPPASAPAL